MCVLTVDNEVEQHVDLLGKLPPGWWQRWDARSKFFNEEGVRIDRIVEGALMAHLSSGLTTMCRSGGASKRWKKLPKRRRLL